MDSQPFVLYVNHPPSAADMAAMSALTEPPTVPADVLARYVMVFPVTPSTRTAVPQAVLREGGMPSLLDRREEKLTPPGAPTVDAVRRVVAAVGAAMGTAMAAAGPANNASPPPPPPPPRFAAPGMAGSAGAAVAPPPRAPDIFTGEGLVSHFSGCMGLAGGCSLPISRTGFSIGSSFTDGFGTVLTEEIGGAPRMQDREVRPPIQPGRPPLRPPPQSGGGFPSVSAGPYAASGYAGSGSQAYPAWGR